MRVVRNSALGCLLAVTLACAAVAAAPQDQPSNPALPGYTANHPVRVGPYINQLSQSAQLAHQYAAAEKQDDKREIRKKLADALSQQFDVHIKEQQKELEDLDKQIASLRSVLKKRLDAKATIVERRVEQLIQEAEGLGWNAPGNPRSAYGRVPGGTP